MNPRTGVRLRWANEQNRPLRRNGIAKLGRLFCTQIAGKSHCDSGNELDSFRLILVPVPLDYFTAP